jgi:alkylhydroperoxidase family enzyme
MSEKIPRISAEQMPPPLASFLAPRVKRLGYLGEFFQCTAHQPEALLSFLQFTEHLKHALPDNLTETVALSVARLMENAYEHVQHERLAIKLGFAQAWIDEVVSLGSNGYQLLSSQEQVVQKLVVSAAQRGGRNTAEELEAVIGAIGPAQAIAVLMLIGRYMSHALIVNALELAPPPVVRRRDNGV